MIRYRSETCRRRERDSGQAARGIPGEQNDMQRLVWNIPDPLIHLRPASPARSFRDCRAARRRGLPDPVPLLLATLVLWGCESGTSTGPDAVAFSPAEPTGQGFTALYAPPPYNVVPYPNDIYNPVVAGLGPTLNVPTGVVRPLAAAVNTLDGFSTVAKITAPFNAPIDTATLIPFNPLGPTGAETVYVLDVTRGAPLVPGLDYSVGVGAATGTNGSVLEITPLRPLSPKTTYLFALTSGIRSTAGAAAAPDQAFGAVRNAHLAGLDSVPGAAGTRSAVSRLNARDRCGRGTVANTRRLGGGRVDRHHSIRFRSTGGRRGRRRSHAPQARAPGHHDRGYGIGPTRRGRPLRRLDAGSLLRRPRGRPGQCLGQFGPGAAHRRQPAAPAARRVAADTRSRLASRGRRVLPRTCRAPPLPKVPARDVR